MDLVRFHGNWYDVTSTLKVKPNNIALSTTDILYGYKPEWNIFTPSIIMSLLQNIKSFFRS